MPNKPLIEVEGPLSGSGRGGRGWAGLRSPLAPEVDVKRWKVWFHRSRAIAWLIVGAVSFPLGWANSVALVWVASVYANALTDISAAEAADDRDICDRLDRIEALLERLTGAPDADDP